jgi:hypothetical protein
MSMCDRPDVASQKLKENNAETIPNHPGHNLTQPISNHAKHAHVGCSTVTAAAADASCKSHLSARLFWCAVAAVETWREGLSIIIIVIIIIFIIVISSSSSSSSSIITHSVVPTPCVNSCISSSSFPPLATFTSPTTSAAPLPPLKLVANPKSPKWPFISCLE